MPAPADRAAIDEANAVIVAAVAAQDAGAVVAFYDDDAIVLPPGIEPISGREAIQDWFTTTFGMGIAWIELLTDALRSVSETMLVEQGRYRIGASEDDVVDAGSYTVYWRTSDDGWKICRDIIVSSAAGQS